MPQIAVYFLGISTDEALCEDDTKIFTLWNCLFVLTLA